ncbi:hypothetical protein [Paludibacterium denitrificans]|uniref:Uncharacterized protein n=1 Tax=Paludibacterium denitrificans TaxID=2675226 RepID=A0A844GFD5_9NEIS|nr:hypothetical protein [Paludibacterium denitrificans]MTD33245.1 hypothetical protein [Paludibacterium denitrificans]
MTSAKWFEGIESQPSPVCPESRHADTVAVCADGQAGVPDSLALPYCGDDVQELVGGMTEPSVPMRCRGCLSLQRGHCEELAREPSHDEAARCCCFAPLPGVRVGRCWLHRIEIQGGRLVWLCLLPTASQSRAIGWARRTYGEAVLAVVPIPGAVSLPAL